jgi:GNAT superfamily N-acetyltransferase
MTIIRDYAEAMDAQAVGVLIAETYRKFNLDFASPEEQRKLLGPFFYAWSADPVHQEAIRRVLKAVKVFVADDDGQIVGVLRCRPGRLQSLFVREDHHRQGIGRQLSERCDQVSLRGGCRSNTVAAAPFAVCFYEAVGYKKSTGLRNGWSFDGRDLLYQPMKKVLINRV